MYPSLTISSLSPPSSSTPLGHVCLIMPTQYNSLVIVQTLLSEGELDSSLSSLTLTEAYNTVVSRLVEGSLNTLRALIKATAKVRGQSNIASKRTLLLTYFVSRISIKDKSAWLKSSKLLSLRCDEASKDGDMPLHILVGAPLDDKSRESREAESWKKAIAVAVLCTMGDNLSKTNKKGVTATQLAFSVDGIVLNALLCCLSYSSDIDRLNREVESMRSELRNTRGEIGSILLSFGKILGCRLDQGQGHGGLSPLPVSIVTAGGTGGRPVTPERERRPSRPNMAVTESSSIGSVTTSSASGSIDTTSKKAHISESKRSGGSKPTTPVTSP
jgi:hypothetical protein